MTQTSEIETKLIAAMVNQKALYEQIIPLSEAALRELENGNGGQDELELINEKMTEVRNLDESIKEFRDHSPDKSSRNNAELVRLKGELTVLVQALFDSSKRLENRIRDSRDNMLPNISQHVVAARMHKAYSRS